MLKNSSIKRLCLCAMCIALCYVLPLAFHALALGSAFSPMHIPVLLCGIFCGPLYGLLCGALGPVLSSILSGMPPANKLISMIPELVTYGFVIGLLAQCIRTKFRVLDIYLSLICAMLAGRVIGGIASALLYLSKSDSYSFTMFVNSYLLTSFPAILLQLVFIPLLILALEKAKVLPNPYTATK